MDVNQIISMKPSEIFFFSEADLKYWENLHLLSKRLKPPP